MQAAVPLCRGIMKGVLLEVFGQTKYCKLFGCEGRTRLWF